MNYHLLTLCSYSLSLAGRSCSTPRDSGGSVGAAATAARNHCNSLRYGLSSRRRRLFLGTRLSGDFGRDSFATFEYPYGPESEKAEDPSLRSHLVKKGRRDTKVTLFLYN